MGKFIKYLLYTVLAVFVLLFFLISMLYLPAVQNYVKKQAVEYAASRFGWDVRIGKFSVGFPLDIEIENVFVSENSSDTLLSAGCLRLNVGIREIFRQRVAVDELLFLKVTLGIKNDTTGMKMGVSVDTLALSGGRINLLGKRMDFKDLQLTGGNVSLVTGTKSTIDTVKSKPFDWSFHLDRIGIRRVAYHMQSVSLPYLSAGVGEGEITGGSVDIGRQAVVVDSVIIRQGGCVLETVASGAGAAGNEAINGNAASSAWVVRAGTVMMDNSAFTMRSGNDKKMEIILSGIGVRVDSVYNRGSVVRAGLKDLKVVQQQGLRITGMRADVDLDTTETKLTGAYIQTPNSLVRLDVATNAPVADLFGNKPLTVKLDAKIGLTDLMYLYENIPTQIRNQAVHINTSFLMTDDRIEIDRLKAFMAGHFNFEGKGKISSLRSFRQISGDFNLRGDFPDITFINKMLKIPVVLPAGLALNSVVKAERGMVSSSLKFTHDKGVMALNADYNIPREIYDINLSLADFGLADFLPGDSLGNVTAQLNAAGQGFKWNKAVSQVKIKIDNFLYKKYNYQYITLSADLKRTRLNGFLRSEDPNLNVDISFKTDSVGKSYIADINGDVKNVDFTRLNLMQPVFTMGLGVNIKTEISGDDLSMNAVFDKIKMTDDRGNYNLGDIRIKVDGEQDKTELNIQSGDFDLAFRVDTALMKVAGAFSTAVAEVKKQIEAKSIDVEKLQQSLPVFTLDIKGSENNTVSKLLKSQNIGFKNIRFNMEAPAHGGIRIDSKVDRPYMDKIQFDSVRLDVRQKGKTLEYSLDIANSTNVLKDIFNINFSGIAQKDELRLGLKQRDRQGQVGLDLGVDLVLRDSTLTASFFPMTPIIGYKRWIINPDNRITLINNRKLTANLKLFYQDKLVSVMSLKDEGDKKERLQMEVKGIDLAEIARITPFVPDISGWLNINLLLYSEYDQTGVDGNIGITDFYYTRQRVGSVDLSMNYVLDKNFTGHAVDFRLQLDSVQRALMKGKFSTSETNKNIYVDLDIPSLPLDKVNIFVPDNVIRLAGELQGKLKVIGTLEKPLINGGLNFRDGQAEVTMLGTSFGLDTSSILLKDSRMLFDNYRFIAPDKSTLAINGYMNLSSFSHIMTDLSLAGNNFQVINVRQNPNSVVYGKAYANVNANMRGEFSALNVTGNVNLLNNTVIDYTLRNSDPELQDKSIDLVRFVSFSDTTLREEGKLTNMVKTNNFNLKMLVEIGNNVSANINLSEDGANRVSIQGGGNLIYSMNPESGNTLVGKYTLSGGIVVYNVPVAGKKTFNIQSGSFVEWTGNLLNPRLSIAASESVKANVMEADQPSRLVTFESIIRIQNTLEQPEITFDLSAPNDMSIQNQLATFSPEERTKQAMNLLIYKNYTGPGAVSSSVNASTTANNTLYGFVENELNKYTQKTGLTFGVDLYNQTSSDGAASTRTDYTYQFSKQLFNDKVNVKIGGRISTDSNEPSQNMEDNLVDDIAIEYVFDKSRNLYLKVFRHTNYESVLEGEVTQTGIGVVLRKSFRKVKDLFVRKRLRDNN